VVITLRLILTAGRQAPIGIVNGFEAAGEAALRGRDQERGGEGVEAGLTRAAIVQAEGVGGVVRPYSSRGNQV